MLCQKDISVVAEHSHELVAVLPHPSRHQRPAFPWAFEGECGHVALAIYAEPPGVKVAVFTAPILEMTGLAKDGLDTMLNGFLADRVRKRLLG